SSKYGHIHFWDTNKLLKVRESRVGSSSFGGPVTFNPKVPDQLSLASAAKQGFAVWDLDKEHTPKTSAELQSPLRYMRYSPDGADIIAICKDNSLLVLRRGEEPRLLTRLSSDVTVYGITISPNGNYVAITTFDDVAQIDKVFLWHIPTGKLIGSNP